jgi:hypothetical protein
MKVRSGFVSNSSSSSFIVGFPKLPSSPETLEKMMFDESGLVQPYDFSQGTPTIEIAKRVFSDMSKDNWKANRLTKKKTIEVLLEGSFPGDPPWDYNRFENKESDKIRRAYEEETGKDINDEAADPKIRKLYYKTYKVEYAAEAKQRLLCAKAFLEGFWPRVKGMKVFQFEYADDGGESDLEHGNIFAKFPHVQISKH